MSLQSQFAPKTQPTAPVKATVPSSPIPLTPEQLGHVAGGTDTSAPGKGW